MGNVCFNDRWIKGASNSRDRIQQPRIVTTYGSQKFRLFPNAKMCVYFCCQQKQQDITAKAEYVRGQMKVMLLWWLVKEKYPFIDRI